MGQAVVTKRSLPTILIVCAFGLLTTACAGTGEETKFPAPPGEIPEGPGLFTGSNGEATFDAKTGKWSVGDSELDAVNSEKTYRIRRRRALARRRQEGATAD